MTELAAALASRATHNRRDIQQAKALFSAARETLLAARRLDPQNYYPVDVLAWATRDMLEANVLIGKDRNEAVVDLLHTFLTSNATEFDAVQQERFHARRLEFGDLLDIENLSDDALMQLEKQGSKAGYYLRARRISGLPDSASDLTAANVDRIAKAEEYLEQNRETINEDGRCLDLLLDLWWLVNAKQRFFGAQRVSLPFSDQQWKYVLQLVSSIELTGQSHRALLLRFISALALFHLGNVEQCVQILHELESEAEQILGMRRVVKSYLASDKMGKPLKYHGTVSWVSHERNRGEVTVDELRRKIDFLPRDFGSPDLRKGSTLGEFHIAFNFLGPVADPMRRL